MSIGPVTYIEKGYGLHQAIAATGHLLYQEFPSGQWFGGGPNGPDFVQQIINSYQPPHEPRWLSSAAFVRRLSDTEWDTINQSTLTNPMLRRLKDKLMTGDPANPGSIDLDSQELSQGIDYVISLGILIQARKAELLT